MRASFSSETWQSSGKNTHLSPNWNVQLFGLGDQQKILQLCNNPLYSNSKVHPTPNKIIFPGPPLPPFRRTSQRRPVWICLIRWWDIKWCQMWKLHIKWNPSMNRFPSTFHSNYIPHKTNMGKKNTSTKLIWNSGFRPLLFKQYNVGESHEDMATGSLRRALDGECPVRTASDTFMPWPIEWMTLKRLTIETCNSCFAFGNPLRTGWLWNPTLGQCT